MDKIVLKNITYRYPTSKENNLKNINLTVKEGTFCAVIGANGSGKTTLLNAIRGFVPKFYEGELSGEVLINGNEIKNTSLGDLAVNMGYVFQNPFTQISGNAEDVFHEIAYGLENLGIEPAVIKERTNYVIDLLKISHLKNRNPFDLSGGQQQKVAFASIIAMEPDIFIIDEPTSQLDPQGSAEIFEIIEMMKKQGKTIVLVEHKMELIAKYAEQVVLISNGEIIFDGKAKEVMSNPQILNYNTLMSKYACLGIALKQAGYNLPEIPINEEDAFRIIKSAVEKAVTLS